MRCTGTKKLLVLIGLCLIGIVVVVVLLIELDDNDVGEEKGEKEEHGHSTESTTSLTTPTTPSTLHPHSVEVMTKCGKIIGTKKNIPISGKVCTEFLNIPYAVPPVGEQRWKRPVLISEDSRRCRANSSYIANKTLVRCVQKDGLSHAPVGNEDCLYLSIRSPGQYMNESLPVLVWIHGGSLTTGYNDMPDSSPDAEYAVSQDVVTVNINYRLNVFGFLILKELWSTENPKLYGNYGFMDMITALKWVRESITSFGGDPQSVTLMGESSGGTAINALLASEMANGLFHRVIYTSASPVWETDIEKAVAGNQVLLNNTACNMSSSVERKNCLLEKDAYTLLMAAPWKTGNAWDLDNQNDLPVPNVTDGAICSVDPVVVPFNPFDLKQASFKVEKKIPILVGTLAQETNFLNPKQYGNDERDKLYMDVKRSMDLFNNTYTSTLFSGLYPNATNNTSNKTKVETEAQFVYTTMTTDAKVTCPTQHALRRMSESSQHEVYYFYMKHRPDVDVNFGPFPFRYSYHTWDILAAFGLKAFSYVYLSSPHNQAFLINLRSLYKTFMHSGTVGQKEWLPYPNGTAIFRNERPWIVIADTVRDRQCQFWLENGFYRYGWKN